MPGTGLNPTGARPDYGPEQRFGVADFFRIAAARWGMIAGIMLATVAVTFVVLMLLPTLYSSSAIVMLDTRKNNVADMSAVLSELPTDSPSLQNQIQILTSRELAAHVIADLKLYDDEEFYSGPTGGLMAEFRAAVDPSAPPQAVPQADATLDVVIDKFLKRLTVETQGLSTTIAVTFSSRDPVKAARIANAVADAYVNDQLTTKSDASRKTSDWLLARVEQLSQQAQAADAAVQQYKAEHNLNQTADGTPLVDQQMTGISSQVVLAKADLAQKQANYNRVASLLSSGHAADASQAVASPLIIQLRTQQADLLKQESDYLSKYGPKNPKLIAVEQQKHDLDNKINDEVTRVAAGMQNDVIAARAQLGSLQGSLSGTEKQAGEQNFARVKLKQLEGNAASTRSVYETFLSRLRQFEDQDALHDSDSRIISRAAVPLVPSSPKRLLILAASVPFGILLGLLAALLSERFSSETPTPIVPGSRRRSGPVRGPFGNAPLLSRIPNALDARAADYVIDYPMSSFAQEMDALATRLAGQGTHSIAVTSAQHGESKTTIAVALARAAARRGLRTVIVDADLRAPQVARLMGIEGVQAGLYEVTGGLKPLSQCLYRDPRSSTLVLSTPRPLRDPHLLLGSPAMSRLVFHLVQTSDLVVIDTAPALESNDTPASARLAEAVLMVVRQPRPEVIGAIEAMQNTGVPPIGVVLAT
ncbi:MAG TPA: exopolysaccharide transport family protein [Rhizomicrobium sp.]|jgi:uncharacterized protein involved in exopolysaccharide biosynthesis